MGSVSVRSQSAMLLLWIIPALVTSAVSKDLDLSTSTTWRCGVFIPIPEEKFQEPLAKYFVFHKKFEAKCPAKLFFTFSKGVFSKKCSKMALQWERLWSPSRQRLPGKKYGDEVCDILNKEVGMGDVPNEVFPEGAKFGFFYTYCGIAKWKDTTVRSEKAVCCKAGRYVSCDAKEEDDSAGKSITGKEPKSSINENTPSKSPKPNSTSTALTQISSTKLPTDKNIDNSPDKPSTSNSAFSTQTGKEAVSADSTLQSSPSSEEKVSTSPKQKERKASVVKQSEESKTELDRINSLKDKLEDGVQLSSSEVEEVKQFITGLQLSASHLLQVAEEYQTLLDKKAVV